jgi:peptidoglycan hydrolase CwlO-like protein
MDINSQIQVLSGMIATRGQEIQALQNLFDMANGIQDTQTKITDLMNQIESDKVQIKDLLQQIEKLKEQITP